MALEKNGMCGGLVQGAVRRHRGCQACHKGQCMVINQHREYEEHVEPQPGWRQQHLGQIRVQDESKKK